MRERSLNCYSVPRLSVQRREWTSVLWSLEQKEEEKGCTCKQKSQQRIQRDSLEMRRKQQATLPQQQKKRGILAVILNHTPFAVSLALLTLVAQEPPCLPLPMTWRHS